MPLTQDIKSWKKASEHWPKVPIPVSLAKLCWQKAKDKNNGHINVTPAYVAGKICADFNKLPYGSWVVVGKHIRLEKYEYIVPIKKHLDKMAEEVTFELLSKEYKDA